MKLSEEMANIILLRYKEAGVFNPKYDKEPLPVDIEIAEEIVSKILDAAVEAGKSCSYFDSKMDEPENAYDAAIRDMIAGINKLRGE